MSSDAAFTIALLVFLVVLAGVIYRLVWLRHVKTDSHLRTDESGLRSGPTSRPSQVVRNGNAMIRGERACRSAFAGR